MSTLGEYGAAMAAPLRVVIGEDDVLMREGIVRLLGEAGYEVVAVAGDADDLLRKSLAHRPDVVVADVQMPPGLGDDGLRAAAEVRRRRPDTGVLILSKFYDVCAGPVRTAWPQSARSCVSRTHAALTRPPSV